MRAAVRPRDRDVDVDGGRLARWARLAHLFVHGAPGAGKDAVASKAFNDTRVQAAFADVSHQGWFVGSTDESLAPTLVAYFMTHAPDVVAGCKQAKALVKIKVRLS